MNVVIWAFYHLRPISQGDSTASLDDFTTMSGESKESMSFTSVSHWDLKCVQDLIEKLDSEGYDDTVHLVSMGGWNGPHLDPYFVEVRP